MAQSQVYALFEDSRGYVWMGTRGGGVCRYDGLNFKTYTVRDGLPSNYISCISEDAEHRLWIGTSNGLSVFDGEKFTNFYPDKDSSIVHIQAIAMGNHSTAWLATNNGIYVFDGKSFSLFKKCFAHHNILSIFKDSEGKIWAGSSDCGLCRIDLSSGRAVTVFSKGSGLGTNAIQSIGEDRKHHLLVGTYGLGIFIYKNSSFSRLKSKHELDQEIVLDIKADKLSNLWVATLTDGVCRWNPEDSTCHFLRESDGLGNNHVRCILQDTRSNLWFGTSGGGVSEYSGQAFNHYDKNNGLSSNFVYSVYRDGQGLLWIGTGDKGLCTYDGKQFRPLGAENGFRDTKVKAISEDSFGDLWIGTEGQGVYTYDGEAFTPIHELHGKYIRYILRDSLHNMWVATAGSGIYKISVSDSPKKRYSVLHIKSDFPGLERINCLAEDNQGRIWFGAETGGIGYIRTNHVEACLGQKEGLNSKLIRSLCYDQAGYLWIGTAGSGVSCLNLKNPDFRFENLNLQNGLNSLNVYLLAQDNQHNLFVGSETGLDKIVFAEGRHIAEINHFGKKEGFSGIETCQNAAYTDAEGTIWFGTVNGLTSLSTGNRKKNVLPPLLHISGLTLFYEPIEKTEYKDVFGKWSELLHPLLLPYNQNHIGFEFTGINLSSPENVKYRWRLEGLEKDWSPASSQRNATYSNLPPGEYIFEVKSCNEDGIWNDQSSLIPFTILKPFWFKTWFLVSSFIFLILLILASFRLRIQTIRKKSASQRKLLETEKSILELEQKALRLQMNPHFIFNALNSIQAQITDNNEQTARHYLAQFSKLMRMILENSRNTYISLEEEISTLENYLSLEKFSSGNRFDFEIICGEGLVPSEEQIPPMMIQPFAENAVIHGLRHLQSRGKITICFRREGNFLECSVTDNGIGQVKAASLNRAQQDHQHKSTALVVTQERLDLMNTDSGIRTLEITDLMDDSGNPAGTRILIRIPIRN